MEVQGAASYRVSLLPGKYVISHLPTADACADFPVPLPCAGQAIVGCDSTAP